MLTEIADLVNPTNVINLESESQDDKLVRLSEYLRNRKPTDLDCMDLIKFCEETLEFVKSKNAIQDLDALIVIQMFAKNLIDSFQLHLNQSKLFNSSSIYN
jgi:hypothetical protein